MVGQASRSRRGCFRRLMGERLELLADPIRANAQITAQPSDLQ
jgi:hypothetical protein